MAKIDKSLKMSLSKLDPTLTSGSSSQVSFDGQNPFSEKQHPLLLPTILDNIFSYLTFPELKSNRNVCKAWSEVGIPFIGRRKLKPVKYSSISHEDFQTLKQEFIKFSSKVKLFQGFQLQWDEISDMISNNFLASFKPSQLVISGEDIIDPSTKLNKLLQPVLITLTDLSLETNKDSTSVPALLNILAQLRPMTLKRLCIKSEYGGNLTHRQMHALCQDFESVFQSQSPFLEELVLVFNCKVSKPSTGDIFFSKIQFPDFQRLQRLKLALEMRKSEDTSVYFRVFAPFNFCNKFPQLVELDILDSTLYAIRNTAFVLTRGHPLMKKLNVSSLGLGSADNIDIFKNLYSSFPYLEELIIRNTSLFHLNHGGIEIPWVNTLRILKAEGSFQFNLGHLKKLEYIHYIVKSINFEDQWILTLIETLLEHHRQLPHLKRLRLTFIDTDFITPERIHQKILEGLPAEFRAILTIDVIVIHDHH